MDMSGEQVIPAPRAQVWAALNDPEILKQAIPGCEAIEKLSDTELTASVVAKVGPVKATFKGKVTLSDIDAPNGYTITGEGQGGVAGFGKGGAKVNLSDADGGATRLTYTAQAQVGGKLAQIGARLVDGAAKKMADDFFTNFNRIVGEQAAATAAPEAAPPTAAPTPAAPPTAAPAKGVPAWIWIVALVVLAGLAMWLSQQ
jgi:carbon monoxide dehydrogenase subunit G